MFQGSFSSLDKQKIFFSSFYQDQNFLTGEQMFCKQWAYQWFLTGREQFSKPIKTENATTGQ